jgi:hypothetical protein
MRVGIDPGPSGTDQHQSSHYVYDVRSGVIVSTYHFVGAAPKSEADRLEEMLKSTHEASRVPLEYLAVLTSRDVPPGRGALHVDHVAQQLVRESGGSNPRFSP